MMEIRAKDEFRTLNQAAIDKDLGPSGMFAVADTMDDLDCGTPIMQEIARLAHEYSDIMKTGLLQAELTEQKPPQPTPTCPIEEFALSIAVWALYADLSNAEKEAEGDLDRIARRFGQ